MLIKTHSSCCSYNTCCICVSVCVWIYEIKVMIKPNTEDIQHMPVCLYLLVPNKSRDINEERKETRKDELLCFYLTLCVVRCCILSQTPDSSSTTPNPPFFLFLCRLSWEV